jgi:allene oxide cyclase
MKKWLCLTAGVALLVVLLAAVSFLNLRGSPPAQANSTKSIHVVEHAITDTVGDTLPVGDSLGDTLGFHNPVFDAADAHQVGTDNGACLRTVSSGKTEWECSWTTFLAEGQITVEGPFYDDGTDTTLAVTGGTGVYTGATGTMLLHARGNPVGSEFDFIFHLSNTGGD